MAYKVIGPTTGVLGKEISYTIFPPFLGKLFLHAYSGVTGSTYYDEIKTNFTNKITFNTATKYTVTQKPYILDLCKGTHDSYTKVATLNGRVTIETGYLLDCPSLAVLNVPVTLDINKTSGVDFNLFLMVNGIMIPYNNNYTFTRMGNTTITLLGNNGYGGFSTLSTVSINVISGYTLVCPIVGVSYVPISLSIIKDSAAPENDSSIVLLISVNNVNKYIGPFIDTYTFDSIGEYKLSLIKNAIILSTTTCSINSGYLFSDDNPSRTYVNTLCTIKYNKQIEAPSQNISLISDMTGTQIVSNPNTFQVLFPGVSYYDKSKKTTNLSLIGNGVTLDTMSIQVAPIFSGSLNPVINKTHIYKYDIGDLYGKYPKLYISSTNPANVKGINTDIISDTSGSIKLTFSQPIKYDLWLYGKTSNGTPERISNLIVVAVNPPVQTSAPKRLDKPIKQPNGKNILFNIKR